MSPPAVRIRRRAGCRRTPTSSRPRRLQCDRGTSASRRRRTTPGLQCCGRSFPAVGGSAITELGIHSSSARSCGAHWSVPGPETTPLIAASSIRCWQCPDTVASRAASFEVITPTHCTPQPVDEDSSVQTSRKPGTHSEIPQKPCVHAAMAFARLQSLTVVQGGASNVGPMSAIASASNKAKHHLRFTPERTRVQRCTCCAEARCAGRLGIAPPANSLHRSGLEPLREITPSVSILRCISPGVCATSSSTITSTPWAVERATSRQSVGEVMRRIVRILHAHGWGCGRWRLWLARARMTARAIRQAPTRRRWRRSGIACQQFGLRVLLSGGNLWRANRRKRPGPREP